jgi:hypothetical protein
MLARLDCGTCLQPISDAITMQPTKDILLKGKTVLTRLRRSHSPMNIMQRTSFKYFLNFLPQFIKF